MIKMGGIIDYEIIIYSRINNYSRPTKPASLLQAY